MLRTHKTHTAHTLGTHKFEVAENVSSRTDLSSIDEQSTLASDRSRSRLISGELVRTPVSPTQGGQSHTECDRHQLSMRPRSKSYSRCFAITGMNATPAQQSSE